VGIGTDGRENTVTSTMGAWLASLAATALTWLVSPHLTVLVWERLFWLMGRRRRQSASTATLKSVLVVRNDGIGDVVLTSPLLRALRYWYPGAWISLVVRPGAKNLVELCPYVNEVLVFNRKVPGKANLRSPLRFCRALTLAAQRLWKRDFDLAIVPRWEVDHYFSSYIAYLSGAPRRIGYSESVSERKLWFNQGYDCLFSDLLKDSRLKHELDHGLDIIKYLGGQAQDRQPEIWLSHDDRTQAKALLQSLGGDPACTLVAFGIGASGAARRWPPEHFAALGSWLKQVDGIQVLLLGSDRDIPIAEKVAELCTAPIVNAAGKTTVRQAAALLSLCSFYVGNNTGNMHIAAALRLPVVEISCNAASCPPAHHCSSQRFGPWGVEHCLVQPAQPRPGCAEGCSQSSAHCIVDVEVDQVKNALASRLPNWCASRAPGGRCLVG